MPVVQDEEMCELTNELWKLLVKRPEIFTPENKDLLLKHFASLLGSVALCVAEGGCDKPMVRDDGMAWSAMNTVENIAMLAGTFVFQVCSDPNFDSVE